MIFKNFFARLAGKQIARTLDLKEDSEMGDSKKWYQSKTVIAGIVTSIVGVYEVIRLNVAPQFGWPLPEIPPIVYTILGAAGIYYRINATKTIG